MPNNAPQRPPTDLLRIKTVFSNQTSPSTGYVPDYSFGRIHYFCNGLSAKTDKEKPRYLLG